MKPKQQQPIIHVCTSSYGSFVAAQEMIAAADRLAEATAKLLRSKGAGRAVVEAEDRLREYREVRDDG